MYGRSVKHQPQRVGLTHELADEDISKYSAAVGDHVSDQPCSYNHQEMICQLFAPSIRNDPWIFRVILDVVRNDPG